MHRSRRTTLLALCACVALMAMAAQAGAATKPLVGVADQKIDTFTDPLFQGLKLKRTRVLVPWDAALKKDPAVDDLLRTIRSAGLEPLVHLNRNCPGRDCKLP